MSDRRAHVKLSRRLFAKGSMWEEPRVFSKPEAWIDLIQWAAWKPHRWIKDNYVEEIDRGEFIASIRYLSKRWGWPKTAVADFMIALQRDGRISRRREGRWGTVYILVNYDYYQGRTRNSGQQTGHEAGQNRSIEVQKQELQKQTETARSKCRAGRATTWLTPYADAWTARCGQPPIKRLAKQLATVRDAIGDTESEARWARYLAENDPKYASPERFAATHQRYAGPAAEMRTDEFGRMTLHTRGADGNWTATDGQASA